ncbi:MAG: EAL domain-containing protein [Cyanobacteria bacterium HKST-UBA02]|nr:EAL domain-containing protein [Cyanobacteria bacterium HKST-UBA02]
MKTRPALYVSCAVVLAAAVYWWMPLLLPVGERTQAWVEQRLTYFRELQRAREDLNNAELNHRAFLLTGERRWGEAFKNDAESLEHDLLNLKNLARGESRNQDRLRALSNKSTIALEQMRQSAQVVESGALPETRTVIESEPTGDLKEIRQDLSRLEEDEFRAVEEQLVLYGKLVGAGPYPLLLVVVVVGLTGIAVFSFGGDGKKESSKEGSESGKTAEEVTAAGSEDSEKVAILEQELEVVRGELDRLARVDYLTEVLNLKGLEHAIRIEENRMGRGGGHMVTILVNCDNFKKINDGLGIASGDSILKDVARRITSVLRPSDHVARVGGDEFVVLLPDTQLAYGLRVAERIRMSVSDIPVHNARDVVEVTVSIGVATLPSSVTSVEEVLAIARPALKRSKEQGRNRVSLGRSGSDREDPAIKEELAEKLTNIDNYRTVFQPIVDLHGETVAGFEILSRGPEGAFENPADFFRVCVENNILTTVDLQCLKLCIGMAADVAEGMRVHINLFPSTILATPTENLLALFPEDRGGRTFCIEISEQHFVGDIITLSEKMSGLRQAGIMVAIDDLGFGRSSLESLIALEPDVVKVDRKYVVGVSRDQAKLRLLKRLANVAKSQGAEIVAEGIEDRDDMPILQELGIHFGQGFLWGDLLEVLPGNPDEQKNLFSRGGRA